MSENDQPSETPPTSSTPPGTPPDPWRAPATAPAWAAGKTPEELLGIAGPAMEMLERFNLSGRVIGQPSNNPTPQYQPPSPQYGYTPPQNGYPTPPQAGQPDPNDFPTWGQLQQFMQQQSQQHLTPQFQTVHETLAAQSLQLLRAQEPNRKVFDKWGPEINSLIAQVPPAARTLDNLQLLVDTVRGRHVEEIARERAAELAATTPPTMRPNGFAGTSGAPLTDTSHSLASDKVPQAWKERAMNAGITDQVIREWCQANNEPVEKFYEMLSKSRVITDATTVAERRNEDGRIVGRETHFGQ